MQEFRITDSTDIDDIKKYEIISINGVEFMRLPTKSERPFKTLFPKKGSRYSVLDKINTLVCMDIFKAAALDILLCNNYPSLLACADVICDCRADERTNMRHLSEIKAAEEISERLEWL